MLSPSLVSAAEGGTVFWFSLCLGRLLAFFQILQARMQEASKSSLQTTERPPWSGTVADVCASFPFKGPDVDGCRQRLETLSPGGQLSTLLYSASKL